MEACHEQRRTPEGSAPQIKGSTPPQRRTSAKQKDGDMAPTLVAARSIKEPAAVAPEAQSWASPGGSMHP
jgi:hypothetical protein